MNRDAVLLIVFGLLVLAGVVALGLGAAGTTRTTVTSGTPVAFDAPPPDGSAGVVFDLHEQSGQSIFGITFTSSSYSAQIGMVAPTECVSQDEDGQDVLSDEGECAGLPAHGEVTGGGTTIGGDRIVVVSVDVSRACYESLVIGDTWPSSYESCPSGSD